MCTVLLALGTANDAPVVVATNRDEFYGRATSEPAALHDEPRIVGGRDVLTRGTWLALSADGRLATVTNRRSGTPDPTKRSRGELPVKLLLETERGTAPGAWIAALNPSSYNPFNILYVSPDDAVVGHATGSGDMAVRELGPGTHVLTLCDVDQPGDAKVDFLAHALAKASARASDADSLLAAMEELLTEHGDDHRADLDAACVHGAGYGTVSSSSVIVWNTGDVLYRHASGPPCQTPRADLSPLLGRAEPVAERR